MLDIGWTELLVVAVVAIVVVGPKDLPRTLRTVGQWTGRMKRMARDFQNQFNEAIREAELDDVKKEVDSISKIDPLKDVKKEVAEINEGMKIEADRPAAKPEPAKAETASADKPAEVNGADGVPKPASEPAKAETSASEAAPANEPAPAKPPAEPVAAATAAGDKP